MFTISRTAGAEGTRTVARERRLTCSWIAQIGVGCHPRLLRGVVTPRAQPSSVSTRRRCSGVRFGAPENHAAKLSARSWKANISAMVRTCALSLGGPYSYLGFHQDGQTSANTIRAASGRSNPVSNGQTRVASAQRGSSRSRWDNRKTGQRLAANRAGTKEFPTRLRPNHPFVSRSHTCRASRRRSTVRGVDAVRTRLDAVAGALDPPFAIP